MKIKDKIIFFLLFLGAISFVFYQIRSVLAPFIIAIIISYLLNPAVNFFVKKFKLSRLISVSVILIFFISCFVVFAILVFPILYNQALLLIDSTPIYLGYFSDNFYPKIVSFFAGFNIEIDNNFFDLVKDKKIFDFNEEFIKNLLINLISSTNFIINIISLIFIMPVLVFYLLKDWNEIIKKIDSFLPKKYYTQIKKIFELIDKSISGFLRGQTNVCLILALYYGILLSSIKLDYGFFIGALTGLMSFVPYIGYGISIVLAIMVALFQWGFTYDGVGVVVAIYILGQIIESNFLVPNLIGKKVQLHPMWIIFGIFFFGAIFGFVGILFSVPLSAIFATLLRYFLKNYYSKS